MTSPLSPHILVGAHADGVLFQLKSAQIILPPQMARDLAALLNTFANNHDPLGMTPLPVVAPQGDPL